MQHNNPEVPHVSVLSLHWRTLSYARKATQRSKKWNWGTLNPL